jgi:AcrR family transcriptional regulator
MGYAKGLDARIKITETARQLFAERGYQQTSIQKVADTAQFSQSAVMHHFPTKTKLFSAVINQMVEDNNKITKELQNPKDNAFDRLMKHFEINYRWGIEDHYNSQIITGLLFFASYDEEFTKIHKSILDTDRMKIVGLVLTGQKEKIFKLATTPVHGAEILHDALLGFMLTQITGGRRKDGRKHCQKKWSDLLIAVTGFAPQK